MNETERIAMGLQQLNREAVKAAGEGRYLEALKLFMQALSFEEQLGFNGHVAETLINIATINLLLDDSPAALEAVDRAKVLFASARRTADLRQASVLRGTVLLRSVRHLEAAQEFESTLRLSPPPEERAAIYAQAAAAYAKLDQHYRAQEYLGRALADFERLSDNQGITACLSQRAGLFKASGRKDLAVRDLQRCATIAGVRGNPMEEYERLAC